MSQIEDTNPVAPFPAVDPMEHAGADTGAPSDAAAAAADQPRVMDVREHEINAELRRALGDETNARRAADNEVERLTKLLRISEEKMTDAKLTAEASINGVAVSEGDLRNLAFAFAALSEHTLLLEALVTRYSGETTLARNLLGDAIRKTATAINTDPIPAGYNFVCAANARYQLQHAMQNAKSLNGILKNVLDLAKLFVPIPIKL